jgi:hypothetical protein
MKAAELEVRLFRAIAAKHSLTVFKSDTKQAFLNGEIRNEKIYIRHPTGGQNEFQRGMPYC